MTVSPGTPRNIHLSGIPELTSTLRLLAFTIKLIAVGTPLHRSGGRSDSVPYQITFNPNWICREVVLVPVINPATPVWRFPFTSNTAVLAVGERKLG